MYILFSVLTLGLLIDWVSCLVLFRLGSAKVIWVKEYGTYLINEKGFMEQIRDYCSLDGEFGSLRLCM